MAMKYLAQDQLQAFLGHLASRARVVAPVADDDRVVLLRPWAPGTEVTLDVLLAKQSAKEYIFRQSETCLTFKYHMEGSAAAVAETPEEAAAATEVHEEALDLEDRQTANVKAHEFLAVDSVNEAPEQVIFGLRPCDARGFVQMDNVFGGYGGFYFDPYYNAKREATTLLAVTCARPRSTCFCRAVGGSPAGTEGADALFTPVDGGFVVEALTPKGDAALDFGGLAEASSGETDAAADVKAKAEDAVDVPFSLEGLAQNLKANLEDPAWHDLAMRCVSCGTCTYVCPNCYCFTINDEKVESSGERVRSWDNCFNPIYTLETSGHNPRDAKTNRFRNRFSHKFWYYPEKYDSLLCSGCGRCISHCPTRIDIREVLSTMGVPREQAVVIAGEEA
jgi:ferredoxin